MVTEFELRRMESAVVYVFERMDDAVGPARFRRQDGDFWITWRAAFGWGAWNEDVLMGRPWDTQMDVQSPDAPPEGKWVSQKGAKSYTYQLVHTKMSPKAEG